MASTTLADYQVLHDPVIKLDAKQSELENDSGALLDFQRPSDFVADGSTARKPILAFKMKVREDNSDFRVEVNGFKVISSKGMDTSHWRGYWEAFSATTAFPEGSSWSNPISLKIFVEEGEIWFSDVVLWYQIKRDG